MATYAIGIRSRSGKWLPAGVDPVTATPPESTQGRTIAEMRVGQIAYTVPWAMWADSNGRLWLNPRHEVSAHPGGTVQMGIRRTGRGFVVHGAPGHTHDTSGWSSGLPVVEFHPAGGGA